MSFGIQCSLTLHGNCSAGRPNPRVGDDGTERHRPERVRLGTQHVDDGGVPMCRLFALHAGADPVSATFWLLDAPDSLREQSHREPDGAGIGVFDPRGRPVIDKQPIAAWEDAEFAREARVARSRTFVAHVRYASTGAHTVGNTHPFAQDGRLVAHNGAFGGLDSLDRRLDEYGVRSLVGGQTDSERMFALITAEARRNGGDVTAAITAALTWISDNLPVFAAESAARHPGRTVGAALPGDPRAVHPRAAGDAEHISRSGHHASAPTRVSCRARRR